MKNKFISISLLLILIFALTGCFSYQDINKVLFVTLVTVDVTDTGEPMMRVEAFHAYRSKKGQGETGNRLVFESTGETIFDAIRNMNRSAIYKMDYTQNKVLVFTEKAAEYGIHKFLDVFMRDQEILLYPSIVIYRGDIHEFLHTSFKQEDFTGTYLNYLLKNKVIATHLGRNQLNQYLNYREIEDQVAAITMITMEGEPGEEKIVVQGSCILKEDKKVGTLEDEKAKIFNLLNNQFKNGLFTISHPNKKEEHITLQVLKAKTKTNVHFESEESISVEKNVHLRISLGETQASLELDQKMIETIQKELEKSIKKQGEDLFHQYAEKKIDLFQIGEAICRKKPSWYDEDVFSRIHFVVNVKVDMTTSSQTRGYR